MEPLVSIALCTYNGSKYLGEQLDSIISQTHRNLEIIVVDDASTDDTYSIIERYGCQDSRIRPLRNKQNIGLQRNFEYALTQCNGEYISIADQDDIWEKDKISFLLKNIGQNMLIYHDSRYVDQKGKPNGKTVMGLHRFVSEQNAGKLLYQNCVSGHASLIHRDLLLVTPPFPASIYYDWWIAYTAACTGKMNFTDKCLVNYRLHSENFTRVSQNTDASMERLAIFLSHPLTPPKTSKLIKTLLQGYSIKEKKGWSLQLLLALLKNKSELFYIRKRSLYSQYKFIIRECKKPSLL